MKDQELADVVSQISEAVSQTGFAERAVSLQQWAADLRSGDDERQRLARQGLRGVVHGMGGLLDIHYGSPEDARRVDGLIDAMWKDVKAEG